jgi:hypothetical protein
MSVTKQQFQAIQHLMQQTIREEVPPILKQEIGFLPTKNEFYVKMDELLGEVRAMRDEFAISTFRNTDIIQRVEKLEDIHPSGKHPIHS